MVLIASQTQTAIMEHRQRSFEENLSMIHDVDLIIVEGYKQEALPRIGICRKATGKGLPADASVYAAVVTDDEELATSAGVPCFGLEDVEELAAFVRRLAGV